jgi:methylglutaconyl-CoA hydratase
LREASQANLEGQSAGLIAEALQSLYQMPQVTLAAIQGAALAGGAGLACACDFIVMENNAVIGFPEVRRGLVAAQVMIFLKKKLLENKIRELLLLGENISALRAYDIGLSTHTVKPEQLLSACLDLSKQVLKASPQAVAATKQLMTELSSRPLSEEFTLAMKYHHQARGSEDAKEGVNAFLEKRKPSWDKITP